MDVDYPKSTALVTGATSRIGQSIAFELIHRKIGRLIIVGRQKEKLNKTEAELRKAVADGQEIRTILVDLTDHNSGEVIQKQIEQWGW